MPDSTVDVKIGVGPISRADALSSGYTGFRADRLGALVTANSRGNYAEAASRGQIFSGMTAIAGTTIVAANNSPIAAAAASAFSLWNPMNSGKNLEILKTIILPISGTPGVGSWVYNYATSQTITATKNNGGTASAAPFPHRISTDASVASVFTQTALTASTLQAIHRPICTIFGGAIAATSPTYFLDMADGDLVVPPGGLLSVASPATGTTFVVVIAMEWLEVAI